MFDDRPQVEIDHQSMIVALTAAMDSLPRKTAMRKTRYRSEETARLYTRRKREMQGLAASSTDRKAVQLCYAKLILKSSREDWRIHVCDQIKYICEAASNSDFKSVWKGINLVAGSQVKYSNVQPSCHFDSVSGKAGEPIESTDELLTIWSDAMRSKFCATPREISERSTPTIPPTSTRADEPGPSDEDLDQCLAVLASRKATGSDRIPIEAFRSSHAARADLYNLIRAIWRAEIVPETMAEGLVVTIFKAKGSEHDTAQYRCIMLLQSCWKILSCYLLSRVMADVKDFLPKTQTAYQKEKSTSQNIFVLAETISAVLAVSKECTLTMIDFRAAFDSTSHKFLSHALLEAGASHKCVAVFQSMYSTAKARVRVREPDGSHALTAYFDIDRGVIQGDCFSALAFIIAVECIMRKHDLGGGISILGLLIKSLEYADDICLIDEDAEAATARVTKLAKAFWEQADMEIAIKKTNALFVRARVATGELSPLDFEHASLTHVCESCFRRFDCYEGLTQHRAMHCGEVDRDARTTSQEWPVDAITDARGNQSFRFYKVEWKGHLEQTWIPHRYGSCSEHIKAYFKRSGNNVTHDLQGSPATNAENRCK